MNISIIIPTYNREKHLLNCLNSILNQKKIPYEVIVVDNSKHLKAKDIVDSIRPKFSDIGISLAYLRNDENSGATARNLGAFKAKGNLVGFLDDDVILDQNYYYEIEKVFLQNSGVLGVQGFDNSSAEYYKKMQNSFFYKALYWYEKMFMISSFYENGKSRVLPSLCVTIPYPSFESIISSEWISTCAGVFSKKVFKKFKFDNQFKKYSWNEYVDFSYSIFLENRNSLYVTNKATYIDVQTTQGRLPQKELIYMSEVYDLYIFMRKFDMSFKNIGLYLWSKLGRTIYNIAKIIVRNPNQFILIPHYFYVYLYILLNYSKIKKGDLNFFNETLS